MNNIGKACLSLGIIQIGVVYEGPRVRACPYNPVAWIAIPLMRFVSGPIKSDPVPFFKDVKEAFQWTQL